MSGMLFWGHNVVVLQLLLQQTLQLLLQLGLLQLQYTTTTTSTVVQGMSIGWQLRG